jgi:hypothetical protein
MPNFLRRFNVNSDTQFGRRVCRFAIGHSNKLSENALPNLNLIRSSRMFCGGRNSTITLVSLTILMVIWVGRLQAGLIYVPNHSFELPVTSYADPRIDIWAQNPNYASTATGVFSNQAPTDATFIHNIDGIQAAFMADAPTVEVSQDYEAVDWAGVTHQFPSQYEVGKAYDLTVGLIGGGGGMPPGSTMQIALYYRDVSSNKVVIAVRAITNSLAAFPDKTNFVDFTAHLPGVKPTDAWAGKYIGIQLLGTSAAPTSGYWDVDNVRLALARVPMMLNTVFSNGQFQSTVQSEPGLKFQILVTTNIMLPRSKWTSLGTVTNTTGDTAFTDVAGLSQRFYQLHQLP